MSSFDDTQRLPVSSHLKDSPSPRSAKRERFPTLKRHSLKSTVRSARVSWSTKLTRRKSSSGSITAPMNVSGGSFWVKTVSFNKVLDFFHLQNLSNTSFEEAIFLHLLYESLATQARILAAMFPGSLQRTLQALLAAMNGCDRSYTKRSAKPHRAETL
jgi:hypothetical protein